VRKLAIILLLVAGAAWAQSDDPGIAGEVGSLFGNLVSAQDLDLSTASIHQAGPDSFYVRSVGIDGAEYSLTFAQDSNGIWTLTALNPESDNILPALTVLDFASLTAVDGQTIQIDGVFVDGQIYSGALSIGEDADLSLTGDIAAGNVDAVNHARTLALAELVVAETAAAFREELAAQRLELESIIDQVEVERDSYKAERDTLAGERDELTAERDSLVEELATIAVVPAPAAAAVTTITTDSPVSDDQVAALLKERDELAGDLVGLAMENIELRDDNKSLAEQIADLQVENQRLYDELASMTSEVQRLTELVEAYRSVGTTSATVAAAPEVIPPEDAAATVAPADETEPTAVEPVATEPAVAEPAAAEPVVPAPVWTLPGDYLRRADLEAAAAAVTAELKTLEGRVAGLEEAAASLAKLEEALRTGVGGGMSPAVSAPDQPGTLIASASETPAAAEVATSASEPTPAIPAVASEPEAVVETAAVEATEPPAATAADAEAALAAADAARAAAETAAELAAVSAELAELVRLNEELRRETLELENRILNDILSNGLVAMMSERMTETVHSGFAGSDPDVGEWSVTGTRAVQADSDAFFAKLSVPAAQRDEPVLYSFRVRALDSDGWVGVGLHFFVSDVQLRAGYGMGKSLLVWLTRDPDVYKTQNTYLQLYRSDDDINMGRVLDAVIQEPISEFLDVEILYEPDNQYMTVAIGGEDKIRYRTWFGIDSGVEVAFRTLGAAEFSDFRIRTEPTESASIPSYGPLSW
jgi:hypothetical protein